MRKWTWSLAVLAWLTFASANASAECPADTALQPGNVSQVANRVYEAGPQRAHKALVEGMAQARQSVPGRVRSLDINVVPEFSTSGASELNEYTADVALTVELGRLAELRREQYAALGDEARAQVEQHRWEYVFAVQSAYLDWWTYALEAAHLDAYVDEASADLDPLRDALEKQQIAAIDVADMEAELARIRAERLEARQRANAASAELARLLGGRCELASVEVEHKPSKNVAASNPWKALASKVDQFPSVKALQARQKSALAGAEAARAQAPWELSVGAGMRSVGFDEYWAQGVIGLSIPLGNPAAPEADELQAAAIAARAESDWQLEQLRAGLAARADRYSAAVSTFESLNDDYLAPLEKRQKMLDAAVDRGRVSVDRVIRARRDLHEAYHKLLMLRAQIQTNHMRAEAMQRWLADDQDR
ncbi:hypothetical protein FIV42_03145 [Persicimonas caeni]|uniref:TolC family protein n=1 Tax=Persicimonas caeni TaxID=2292766 RepID=A0A4Y6PP37_PERCE|nr:TolC family protein [Persicimonas caeni]QDG49767.1 hypothetical protein FIV42_03145 [Persicimonas caeni]QED30988.1 hypothetical protein FRD00_03140 [Persicimonas caeni]